MKKRKLGASVGILGPSHKHKARIMAEHMAQKADDQIEASLQQQKLDHEFRQAYRKASAEALGINIDERFGDELRIDEERPDGIIHFWNPKSIPALYVTDQKHKSSLRIFNP